MLLQIYIFFSPPTKKNFFCNPKKILIFALASLPYINGGGQLHIERRYLRFVFVYLNVGTSNIVKQEQKQKGRHGLCIYNPVVCQGYTIPFRTLYGCIYTNKRGAILKVLLTRVSYNPNSGTDGSKSTPLFLCQFNKENK